MTKKKKLKILLTAAVVKYFICVRSDHVNKYKFQIKVDTNN